jgi:hypothetical protein
MHLSHRELAVIGTMILIDTAWTLLKRRRRRKAAPGPRHARR